MKTTLIAIYTLLSVVATWSYGIDVGALAVGLLVVNQSVKEIAKRIA